MAACTAAVSHRPMGERYHDDVFLSDTDDGLLVLNEEDIDRFTPSGGHLQSKQQNSGEVAINIDQDEQVENDEEHSDFAVVEIQPRRTSDINSHFQPSQIEEKLLNHRLLNGEVAAAEGAKAKVAVNNDTSLSSSGSPRRRRASIWNGMVACLSPVVSYFKKEKQPKPQQDEWEIDFADISELDFIGSGAQGAVFAGEYLGRKVAVKKVKDPKYCEEAWQLRKLNHPNIVKLT